MEDTLCVYNSRFVVKKDSCNEIEATLKNLARRLHQQSLADLCLDSGRIGVVSSIKGFLSSYSSTKRYW